MKSSFESMVSDTECYKPGIYSGELEVENDVGLLKIIQMYIIFVDCNSYFNFHNTWNTSNFNI